MILMVARYPFYPSNPDEWRQWIRVKLDIDHKEGVEHFVKRTFPFRKLVRLWQIEFTPDKGYSPDFIPALIRNKMGFVSWVYGDGPEPNWTKDDLTNT